MTHGRRGRSAPPADRAAMRSGAVRQPGTGRGRATAPGTSTRAALPEQLDRLVDAPLPGLGALGAFDGVHEPRLLAVGEPVEEPARLALAAQRAREIGGDGHLPRLGVELDLDVDLVAGRNAGGCAVLGVDANEEPVAPRCHGAAVGVAVDRDLDRRLPARPEDRDVLVGDVNPGGSLACGEESGTESHLGPFIEPTWFADAGSTARASRMNSPAW